MAGLLYTPEDKNEQNDIHVVMLVCPQRDKFQNRRPTAKTKDVSSVTKAKDFLCLRTSQVQGIASLLIPSIWSKTLVRPCLGTTSRKRKPLTWTSIFKSGPRSTQPCIPPGSLNRVPASARVKAGKSPLPGGR